MDERQGFSAWANQPDSRRYIGTSVHEEALARLEFLIEQHRRCGLLYGRSGTGKSLLLRVLAEKARRSACRVACVDALAADADRLAWLLAAELGVGVSAAMSPEDLRRGIADRLAGLAEADIRCLLLFDHVERAQDGGVRFLEWVVESLGSRRTTLTTIVAVRSVRPGRRFAALAELCDLPIGVPPLAGDDLRVYVEALLGRTGVPIDSFTPQAVETIERLTGGIPRIVDRLCELAILGALSADETRISAALVEEAGEELGLADSVADDVLPLAV